MGSTNAIPAILVLLGVVLVFAGLFFSSRFELVVLGAVVAIAGGAFALLSAWRHPSGRDDSGAAGSEGG